MQYRLDPGCPEWLRADVLEALERLHTCHTEAKPVFVPKANLCAGTDETKRTGQWVRSFIGPELPGEVVHPIRGPWNPLPSSAERYFDEQANCWVDTPTVTPAAPMSCPRKEEDFELKLV